MNAMITIAVNKNELLSDVGMTVLIGVSVVFAVLVALTCIFWLFGVVARGKSTTEVTTKVVSAPSVAPVPVVEDGISDEVVAVIAAAVAAMSDGNTQYTIRRIRPARTNARPVWATAGIAENTQPF